MVDQKLQSIGHGTPTQACRTGADGFVIEQVLFEELSLDPVIDIEIVGGPFVCRAEFDAGRMHPLFDLIVGRACRVGGVFGLLDEYDAEVQRVRQRRRKQQRGCCNESDESRHEPSP